MGTSDHIYQRYFRAFCADEPFICHIVIYTWAVAICDIIKKSVKKHSFALKGYCRMYVLYFVFWRIIAEIEKKKKGKKRREKKN